MSDVPKNFWLPLHYSITTFTTKSFSSCCYCSRSVRGVRLPFLVRYCLPQTATSSPTSTEFVHGVCPHIQDREVCAVEYYVACVTGVCDWSMGVCGRAQICLDIPASIRSRASHAAEQRPAVQQTSSAPISVGRKVLIQFVQYFAAVQPHASCISCDVSSVIN